MYKRQDQYNALESAPVEKHGKKGNKIIELKEHLPKVEYTTEGDSLHIDLCMPAAQEDVYKRQVHTAGRRGKARTDDSGLPDAEWPV